MLTETPERPLLVRLHDPDSAFSHEEFLSFVAHEDRYVRAAAAGREDCPLSALEGFGADADPCVLASAAGNLAATPIIFDRAFNYPKKGKDGEHASWAPRLEACGNPNLPRHYAMQYGSFDWAELLAYINSGNALPAALEYAINLPKPDNGGTDQFKEIRTVAGRLIDITAAAEKIYAAVRQAPAFEGLAQVELMTTLGLGQLFHFALRHLLHHGRVRQDAGRLYIRSSD